MKQTYLLIALMLTAMVTTASAAPVPASVNVQASTLKWEGGNVVGKMHHGTIALQEGELQLEKNVPVNGIFVVDMSSINNEDQSGDMKAMLEKHLKSPDFFNVDTFPTAKFIITKVMPKGGKNYAVTGNLTIKDKTNPVTFDATLDVNGKVLKASAKFTINRALWEVKYGSTSFFKGLADKAIKDEITFDVNIEAAIK